MIKHIWDLTLSEIEILFQIADFTDFKITRLEKGTDCGIVDCLTVFAESEWEDGDDSFIIEDEIVKLFPTSYEDSGRFSRGFYIPPYKYIQWSLWCNLIEQINFDHLEIK